MRIFLFKFDYGKKKEEKRPKPCAEHYEPKLKIEGSFSDVIGMAVGKNKGK